MKTRICVITSTRADYGLLYWLIKEIKDDNDLELQIIATGMHLSEEFGYTYKEIEKDFVINKKIQIDLSDDSEIGIIKSMSEVQIKLAIAYKELNPQLIIILGDRYEMLSAATSALISKIPIAHLHGGEVTIGAFDDALRHSITKMSHLHFTATSLYQKRVIQLGENPKFVFNVGGFGIDNILKLKLLSKDEFEKSIDFKLNKKNILLTYHSVTLENNTAKEQFINILKVIDKLEDTNIIFTKSNSDTNGKIINILIDEYVNKNKNKSICFTSLGQTRYLSALKFVDVVVGNSSSGLTEVPSFKIATINIGNRQKGRLMATSVISCNNDEKSIKNSFDKLYTNEFIRTLKTTINPYGNGGASKKTKDIIKSIKLDNIIKKYFYDL